MLYSKNGSIPKDHISGTKQGWEEVDAKPEAPEGKEVVWWFPPGWVIRDPKPAATETSDFSWSQSEGRWVEYTLPEIVQTEEVTIIGGASAEPIGASASVGVL